MQLGPAEILVVLVVALLVFGPQKLPEVGRQVGRAMKEFKRFQQMMTSDFHDVFAEDGSSSAEPAPQLPPKDPIDVVATEPRMTGDPTSTSNSASSPPDEAKGTEPEGHA